MAGMVLGLAPGLYSYFGQGHTGLSSFGVQLAFGAGLTAGAMAGSVIGLGVAGNPTATDPQNLSSIADIIAGFGMGSAAGGIIACGLATHLAGYGFQSGAIDGAIGVAALYGSLMFI